MCGQQLYSAITEEMNVVSILKRNSNATTLFDVLREFCYFIRSRLTNVFVWNGKVGEILYNIHYVAFLEIIRIYYFPLLLKSTT